MSTAGPSKRLPYTAKACTQCKRRKAKCSGEQPRCAACLKFGEECVYQTERDARKSSSAAYISALEERIKQLEAADSSSPSSSSDPSLVEQNQALKSRILVFERALSSRGVSISEIIEEDRAAAPAAKPIAIADKAAARPPLLQTTSSLGKRASSASDDDAVADDELGLTTCRRLQISEDSNSLLYHGPSSALLHSVDSDTPSSPPRFAPISASLDFSPSPFGAATSSTSNFFDLSFLTAGAGKDDLDWARNLPVDLGITREAHDNLLDLFEAFFATWCNIVDMKRFRQDMATCLSSDPLSAPAPTRTDFYSPMLHNAILALSCPFYRGPRIKNPFPSINPSAPVLQTFPFGPSTFFDEATDDPVDLASRAFYVQARASFDIEVERPMLSTVRALFLVSSFNSNCARANTGFLLFGTALRTAMALGVNIASDAFVRSGVITPQVKLARDNCFWSVVQQDALWSIALGRFVAFRPEDHEIPLPAVDAEEDAAPWVLPSVWEPVDPNASGQLPPQLTPHSNIPSYSSSCFLATAKLAQIQTELINDVYSLKHTPGSSLIKLSLQLEAFAAELPRSLQIGHYLASPPPPHILTLHLIYLKTVLLLHRPFFHRPSDTGAETSIKRCENAASQIMRLVELYDSAYGIAYGPLSNVQTLFITGTVFLLSARRSIRAAKRLKAFLDGAESCCVLLRKMSVTWKWAGRTERILRSLVKKWTNSSPSPSPSPPSSSNTQSFATAPSPATAPLAAPLLAPSLPLSAPPFPTSFEAPAIPPSLPSYTPPAAYATLFDPFIASSFQAPHSTAPPSSGYYPQHYPTTFGTDASFEFAGIDPLFGGVGGWNVGGGSLSGTAAGGGGEGGWPFSVDAFGAPDPSVREGVEPYVP
ncbi:hypothetical protein JCM8097_002347 [Rhodosporidiobolus ruineniae]